MTQLINNSKPQSPCKGCVPPDRYLGCHSVCPDYIKFVHDKEIAGMELKQKKMKDSAYEGYKKDRSKIFVK